MQLTKNFHLSEFASKDGKGFPPDVIPNIKKLAANLQIIRDTIGKPININSGYRSPEHNAKIGGAKNSYHVKGMAADIVVKDMTPKEIEKVILQLIHDKKIEAGGLKAYNTFVHYDVRGRYATW